MPKKTETLFYTDELAEQIAQFVTKQWDVDEVYTLRSVADAWKIDIRNARYYLMKWVDRGYLCQITFEENTYYALRCWKVPFQLLGLRVI